MHIVYSKELNTSNNINIIKIFYIIILLLTPINMNIFRWLFFKCEAMF